MTILSDLTSRKTNPSPPCLLTSAATSRVAAREGDDAFLLVLKGPGSGPILDVSWAKGSRQLVGDRYRVGENNNSVHLTLQGITREDEGEYTVTAKNIAGESRSAVYLRIKDGPFDEDDAPIFLRRLNDLAVKVGTRTRFLVEIRSSSDVKVTWNRNDVPIPEEDRFHLLHEGNFFCVDVAPVTVHDGGRWSCVAENETGRSSCSCRLSVLVPKAYKSPEFLEELKAVLTDQGTVSLECKVVGVPTPVLKWYKDGKEIKPGDMFALTASPEDPTSLGMYTCEATNCMGKAYSSSRVHVSGKGSREGSLLPADHRFAIGPPPQFKKELKDEKVKIGNGVTLSCHVAVPPWPKTINWYNKEGKIQPSEKYHIMEDGLGGYSIEIYPLEACDEGEWKCVATSDSGVISITKCMISMTYPKNYRKPKFLESLKAILTEEGLVSFECKVVGFPTPRLQWFKDGEELRPGDVYQLTGTNSLGSYSCIARNCMGEARSTAELTVEDIQGQLNEEEKMHLFSKNQPPRFIRGLKSCEAKINEDFRFTVQVTLSPGANLFWYRDDEKIEEGERFSMVKENVGVCHLVVKKLEINDQAEWKCVASNEFGQSITTGFLKLTIPKHYKKPKFLECLRAIMSEEGAVNLECKVIGVPQPVLKWYKDGKELKPGDIHRIISGEDGKCCLGTYTCEARNCMGVASSSASLLGFEDRKAIKEVPRYVPEPLYPLAKNTSLSTIHEERTSQMYDTPGTEHSITMDERGDVSFSFDGKEVSISLYETPDLTEEEALQVVEMYAEELSEHISEQNVVELPPMRFTKESSKSGPLLMEAVVIDVSEDYFSTAEDDLRTEADFEDVSMAEEGTHNLASPEVENQAFFEKINSDFLEKALASLSGNEQSAKKKSSSDGKDKSDSYKSLSSPKKGSVKGSREEVSGGDEMSDSKAESFGSAKGSSGLVKQESDPSKKDEKGKKKISRSRSTSMDSRNHSFDEKVEEGMVTITPKRPSISRSSSGGSDEKSSPKKVKKPKAGSEDAEETATRRRRSSRSASESMDETIVDNLKKKRKSHSRSQSAESETTETLVSTKKVKKKKVQPTEGAKAKEESRKSASRASSSEKESMKGEKKRRISASSTDSAGKEGVTPTATDETATTKKKKVRSRSSSTDRSKKDSERKKSLEMIKKTIAAEVEAPVVKKLEEQEKKAEESKIVETSLKEIQNVLNVVKEQVIQKSEKAVESGVISESFQKLQEGLQVVQDELKLEEVSENVLHEIVKPVQNFEQGLRLTAEQKTPECAWEMLSAVTNQLQEQLKTVTAKIVDVSADSLAMAITTLLEPIENVAAFVSDVKKPQAESLTSVELLQNLAQPVQELQEVIESAKEQHATTSEVISSLTEPVKHLLSAITIVERKAELEMEQDESVSEKILEKVSRPIAVINEELKAIEHQIEMEQAEDLPMDSSEILEALSQPIQDLHRGLAEVVQEVLFCPPKETDVTILRDIVKSTTDVIESLRTTTSDAPPSQEQRKIIFSSLETPLSALRESVTVIKEMLAPENLKEIPQETIRSNVMSVLGKPLRDLQHCLQGIESDMNQIPAEIGIQVNKENILQIVKDMEKGVAEVTEGEKPVTDLLSSLLPPLRDLRANLEEKKLRHPLSKSSSSLGKSLDLIKQTSEDDRAEVEEMKINLSVLRPLEKPLQDLEEGFGSLEEHILQKEGISPKEKPTIERQLQTLLEILSQSFEVFQEKWMMIEANKEGNASLMEANALLELVKDLKKGTETIQENLVELETISPDTKRVVRENVNTNLKNLKKSIIQVENLIVQESVQVIPEFQTLTANIAKVQENMQALKEKLPESKKALEKVVKPIADVQKTLEKVKLEEKADEEKPALDVVVEKTLKAFKAELEQTERSLAAEPKSIVGPFMELKKAVEQEIAKEATVETLEPIAKSLEKFAREIQAAGGKTPSDTLTEVISLVQLNIAAIDVLENQNNEAVEPLKEPLSKLNEKLQEIKVAGSEMADQNSIVVLQNLVEPLNELKEGLGEAAVEPGVLKTSIAEMQKGIATIQQQAALRIDDDGMPEHTHPMVLETLLEPFQELQESLAKATEKISESELVVAEVANLKSEVVQALSQSLPPETVRALESLQEALESGKDVAEAVAEVQCQIENASPKEKKTLLKLRTELENVEEVLNATDVVIKKKKKKDDLVSSLETAVKELQHGLESAIEVFKDEGQNLQFLTVPLYELGKALEKIQTEENLTRSVEVKHQLVELAHGLQEFEEAAAGSEAMKALSIPIKENMAVISNMTTAEEKATELPELKKQVKALTAVLHGLQEAVEVAEGNLESDVGTLKVDSSFIKTIAQPVQELKHALAEIKEHVQLEKEDNLESAILQTLAKPIQQLQMAVAVCEQQAMETSETIPSLTLEQISQPILELNRGLAQIQQQVTLLSEKESKPAEEIVKSVAKPIQELVKEIATIQEHLPVEPDVISASNKTEISVMKTLAKPVEEMQKIIAVVEEKHFFEPEAQSMSSLQDATIAKPLQNLKHALEQLQNLVLEGTSAAECASAVEAVAKPVRELEHVFAVIQSHECAKGETTAPAAELQLVETLATPVHELATGLVVVQQQLAESGVSFNENKTEPTSFLTTLIKPEELQKMIALVQEYQLMEPEAESISSLHDATIAQPLQSLRHGLEQLQNVIMEATTAAECAPALEAVAKPVCELEKRIATMLSHEQFKEETAEETKEMEILTKLATPIHELASGLVILEQQIMGSSVKSLSDLVLAMETIGKVETLSPLEKVAVQEQVAFEAEGNTLSQLTNFEEATLRSATLREANAVQTEIVQQDENVISIKSLPQEDKTRAVEEEVPQRDTATSLQAVVLEADEVLQRAKSEASPVTTESQEVTSEYTETLSEVESIKSVSEIESDAFKPKKADEKKAQEENEKAEVNERITKKTEVDLGLAAKPDEKTKTEVEEKREMTESKSREADVPKKKGEEVMQQKKEQEEVQKREENISTKLKDEAEVKTKKDDDEEKPKSDTEGKKRQVDEEKTKREREEKEAKLKAEIEDQKNEEEAKLKAETKAKEKKEEEEAKKKEDEEVTKKQKEEEQTKLKAEVDAKKKHEEEVKKKEEEEAKKKKEEESETRKAEEEAKRKEEEAKKKKEEDEKLKVESEVKKKQEEEARRKEEEEAKKKKEEEEAKLKADIEAKKKEEEAKKKKEEEEAKLKAENEARKKLEEEANKKKEEEEAKRKEEEEAKLKAEAEAKKKKEEEEAAAKKKKDEEEEARKKKEEEEAKKKKEEEEAKLKAEAEAKKKEEEEAEARKKQEEEAKKKKEEEEAKKKKEEEEAKKKKEEEEAKKKKEEEEAKKKKEEEEAKLKAEAEAKKKKEQEEAKKKEEEEAKLKAEAEAKKKKEEEEAKKKKEEEEAKKKEEEEAKLKAEADAKKKKEEEEAKLKAEAEAKKKKDEEEAKKKKEEEEKKKKEEEAKKKKEEEEAKLKAEAEAKKKREEEEAEARKKQEEEAKKKEEEEAKRKKEQEEAKKKKEEEEEKKKKEEEAAKKKKKEEEEVKKKEEEEAKLKAEAEAKKKKEEEEAAKKKKDEEEEARKKKEEEEAKKKKEEEEAKLKAEAEAKKKKEEEEAEARKKQEEEAKKKKEEEEAKKKKEEEEAKKKKEEEEKKKKEEEAAKKKKEEEEAKKKKEEEEAKLKAEAEAKKKKEEEEAAKKKKEEEEAKKKKEEEEAKLKAEAEAKKKKEEEEAKLKAEAEAKKKQEEEAKKKEEEQAKKKKEEEEKKKKEEEAAKKKKEEEEAKLKAEAEAKKKQEEEAKRKKEEEEAKLKAEAEAKKKQEEEAKKKKEEEEQARKKKEEEEAKLKAEAEAKKKKEEEELKKKKEEEEKKKKEEEEKKKKEEAAAKKKKEEEEAKKKKEEEEAKKKKEEEEAKKKKEEEEAKLKAEAEAKKKKEEEAAKKKKEEEEAKKKKEEEEKKKKEEEAAKKKKEEEEAKKKKEEEEKKKKEEEATKKKKEEEEAKKKKEEEEAKKKKEEEEAKLKAEAEAKKKKEEEEAAKKKKEDEEAKKKEEEEAKLKAEAEAKKKKEDEEAKKKKEEKAKKKKEEEEAKKKKEEEEAKKKEEEEANLKAEAEAKKKKEEEVKRKEEEEAKKKDAEEEAKKIKKEEEEMAKEKQEGDVQVTEGKQKQDEESAAQKKKDEVDDKNKKRKSSKKKKEEEEAKKKKEEEAKSKADAESKTKEEESRKKQQEQAELESPADSKKEKDEVEEKVKKETKLRGDLAENKNDEQKERLLEDVTKEKAEDRFTTKQKEVDDSRAVKGVASDEDEIRVKKRDREEKDGVSEREEPSIGRRTERETASQKEVDRRRGVRAKWRDAEEMIRTGRGAAKHRDVLDTVKETDVDREEVESPRARTRPEQKLTPTDTSKKSPEREHSRGRTVLSRDSDYASRRTASPAPAYLRGEYTRRTPSRDFRFDYDILPEIGLKYKSKLESIGKQSWRTLHRPDYGRSLIDVRSYREQRKMHDITRRDFRRIAGKDYSSSLDDLTLRLAGSEYSGTQGKEVPRDKKGKPVFCSRLVDRTAPRGSRVKLTCTVLGTPEPSVKWLRHGLPLIPTPGDRYSAKIRDGIASLEIEGATQLDNGEYTCLAQNIHGESSTTCKLRIFDGYDPAPFPPTFTTAVRESYKFTEDELILECRVRSHPPPKVQWLRNGVPLRPSPRYQQTESSDGICRLIISHPEVDDSGDYTCRAENQVADNSVAHRVKFLGRQHYAEARKAATRSPKDFRKPHFRSELTDHLVPAGGTIALQVEVRGLPPPEVKWLRGNEELPRSSSKVRFFEDSGVHTLLVSNASETEAGIYSCHAYNAFGHVRTTAAVEVMPVTTMRSGKPPKVVNRPKDIMVANVEDDVVITCRVTGDPRPRVSWMKGTKDITITQRTMVDHSDDYYRFTLKKVVPADAGTYWIIAKNIHGHDRAFVTLQVKQRARSLTPGGFSSSRWDWGAPSDSSSEILSEIHDREKYNRKETPGPITSEPFVADSGRNWLTLSWKKPSNRGGAPVIAYRVDAWEIGQDGGARWSELGITPVNTFDAYNLKKGKEYKFRITPRNRYGWGEPLITSSPVTVGFKGGNMPEFTKILPGQLKALYGASIRLECHVTSDLPPETFWYKDGIPLDLSSPRLSSDFDGTVCQLVVSDLVEEDSGRYMCEAVSKVGRVSTFARLMVVKDAKVWEADTNLKRGVFDEEGIPPESPPLFTMRLRDRRVQMTYPVRLTCQVVGSPTPEVKWYHEGKELNQDDRHTFSSEDHFHTLEMSKTTLEDAGCYTATAKNDYGSVSCRCNLVVDKGIRAYVAPEFVRELEVTRVVRCGDEMHLTAQVEAYPSVGVVWHRNGVRLRPSRRIVMTLNHEGLVELIVGGVTEKDSGVYACTATNEVGRCETVCRVSIQSGSQAIPRIEEPELPYSKAPMFVKKPRSNEAVEGDAVVIECQVIGDPKPEVYWLRDFLKPEYYRDAPLFRRIGDGTNYRLEIPHVKLDHTGTYTVVARNTHGEVKAVTSLQVYAKGQGKEDRMDSTPVTHGKVETLPVFKKGLKHIRCCDGDAVTLECEVEASPEPQIKWRKGERAVPLGGDFSAEFDGRVARLIINQVYPEDEGEYVCEASNDVGKTATSACLVVDVPEEKENLLSRQLTRPPGLMSGCSTPRSTPRTTPSRSISPYPAGYRFRSTSPGTRPRRLKVAPPKFYAVPHNRIAQEGETVRFQCAVAGHPTPWVTWDKDGRIVTPTARITMSEKEDLKILEISEVTAEDAGLYRIVVENEVGRIEATARLEVIGHRAYEAKTQRVRAWSASPTFRRRPCSSIGRLGDNVTLACDIRSSPNPVTSWYRNGELVVRTNRVTPTWNGETAMLEIENLEMEDAGVYICVAENEFGKAECSTEVVVLEDDPARASAPVFLEPLNDVVAEEGRAIELQTRIQGDGPLEIVWSKDNKEIPDCEDFHYVDYGDGRYGLRIADTFIEDSGEYSCEVFNKFGDAISSARVWVKDGAPRIVFSKIPTSAVIACGKSATFCSRIESTGSQTPVVSWIVADREIGTGSSGKYSVEEDGDVSFLHISSVDFSDAGRITCVARYGCSLCDAGKCECRDSRVTCSAELTVVSDEWVSDSECDALTNCDTRGEARTAAKMSMGSNAKDDSERAQILLGPADVRIFRGGSAILTAKYCGQPKPKVRWTKGGRQLTDDNRIRITKGKGSTTLRIDSVSSDDSGKYVVSVENVHGSDRHFASLAVEGPPEPPSGRPTATVLSADSAAIEWSSPAFDGGCKITEYAIEMKSSSDPDWKVIAIVCDSLSHVLKNLQQDEKYKFRIMAENKHGRSEPSSESNELNLKELRKECSLFAHPKTVTVEDGELFKAKFEVLEELGKGRFGIVHKVADLDTGEKLAAKFIRCITVKDREKVKDEIAIMNCLRHPKLLQLAAAFESPREMVMVMEYISGGELFERVVADDFQLTERDCILFMRQICEGVRYMHENSVVHLDLKPENIMCQTRTSHEIKLIDFGLAQKIDPENPVRVLFGTPEFVPPEVINYEPIGFESDMWSVGVICYVLLSGLSPFMGENDAETFANITRASYDFDEEAFRVISQDAKDFISSLLVKRKEKRLTASECLRNKWMLSEHDETMGVILSTDKLKKFIIRRKWQKTGNAIRALGRLATLSAATRRSTESNSNQSVPKTPAGVLKEEPTHNSDACGNTSSPIAKPVCQKIACKPDSEIRSRLFSERSDSGISDCSSSSAGHSLASAIPLFAKKYSIDEAGESRNEPAQPIGNRVELIREKFANLSKNIDEMDKKLETVGRKLVDIGAGKLVQTSKSEIKRVPSLKDSRPDMRRLLQPTASSQAKATVPKSPVPTRAASPARLTVPTSPELRTGRLSKIRQELDSTKANSNVFPTVNRKKPEGLKSEQRTQTLARRFETAKAKDTGGSGSSASAKKETIAGDLDAPAKENANIRNGSLNFQKAVAFWKR